MILRLIRISLLDTRRNLSYKKFISQSITILSNIKYFSIIDVTVYSFNPGPSSRILCTSADAKSR